MNWTARVSLAIATASCGLGVYACSADSSTTIPGGDASADATASDGASSPIDGSVQDASFADANDAGIPAVPCAPPSDPTKAALCIQVTHEDIDFFPNDPRFDGVGLLIAQVFPDAVPDFPDGGEEPSLAATTLPAFDAGADAGLDLRNPVPVLRFDGLPAGPSYPRIFFADNETAVLTEGWWVAGLDFSQGFKSVMPLAPVTLSAGQGTGIVMNLTALRALVVTATRSVDPQGDGEGLLTIAAYNTSQPSPTSGELFGVGTACANLSEADASAQVVGFVIGQGPYYLAATLDDFGVSEAGSNAGELVSIVGLPDGSAAIPPQNKTNYLPTTYIVTQSVDLNFAVPKPATPDNSQCP